DFKLFQGIAASEADEVISLPAEAVAVRRLNLVYTEAPRHSPKPSSRNTRVRAARASVANVPAVRSRRVAARRPSRSGEFVHRLSPRAPPRPPSRCGTTRGARSTHDAIVDAPKTLPSARYSSAAAPRRNTYTLRRHHSRVGRATREHGSGHRTSSGGIELRLVSVAQSLNWARTRIPNNTTRGSESSRRREKKRAAVDPYD